MKRLFDLIFSLVLLFIAIPVMVFIALLIACQMGFPIFFRQDRPGYRGKIFTLYKFRTMENSISDFVSVSNDQYRLTPLGKWMRKYSLDELPQLLNVLKGELSFVGPRPLLKQYLERYSPEQARRHEVKPGITGWAQVNGRNAISWEEKFEYDVWYVDHLSFFLDLKILWLTLIQVLKAEGITQNGMATMSEFSVSKDEE